MKKFLSLLLLMLLCTSAWAAEKTVTFDSSNFLTVFGKTGASSSGNNEGDLSGETTVTYDGISLTVSPPTGNTPNRLWGTSSGIELRMYTGSSLTIAANKITKIVFTHSKWNTSNTINSVTPTGTTSPFTWTSTEGVNEVVISIGGTTQFVSIAVTYETSETPAPASPTILLNGVAPATSYYVSDLPLSLTITSNNGNEIPYYQYTFTDPDGVTSTIRGNATELIIGDDDVLNLKMGLNKLWVAEAIPNSETEQWSSSQWASATFTIKEDPTTVANIAALTALADGTLFRMTGTATVVYVNDKYMYIKDETGSTLLYQSKSAAEKGYTISNIVGEVSVYNNLFEVKNAEFEYQPNTIEVEPVVMTIPNIASTNMNQYVKVEGLTLTGTPTTSNRNFTMSDGANSLAGYWRFNDVVYPTDLTKIWDVTGFVAVNGQTVQLFPTDFTDATPAASVETPVITFDKENPVEGETVNCTITCATEGATIMYALGEGEYQNYTAAIPLTETTTVKAKATKDGAESNVATATITFAAPPVTLDGMIVFKDNANDGSAMTESEEFMGQIEKGNNYVAGAEDMVFVYPGKEGLKIGKSGAAGSMTLNLANKWDATKISFIAKRYNAGKAVTMTVKGQEFELTGDFALYEIALNPAEEVQAITLATTQYAYLKVINIEGEVVDPQPTYTITLDKQPGEYSTLINVKATVEPALPEGATLKYTIDGANPVAYDAEKGVCLLKSSELKFTAYDAQNNPLTDPVGGQYKYIVNVFGDMDGDGEVTVSDLNIVLNLILGKI